MKLMRGTRTLWMARTSAASSCTSIRERSEHPCRTRSSTPPGPSPARPPRRPRPGRPAPPASSAPGYKYATTAHPVAVLTEDKVKERAAQVLDDVVSLLTDQAAGE